MLRSLLAVAALTASAFPAYSQIQSAVGPTVAPEGSPIVVSYSNDTSGFMITGICPYQVFDESGTLIFTPTCLAIAIVVPPGGTFDTTWNQELADGTQVPPGKYRIDVDVPELGLVQHEIEISAAVDAAVTIVGVPKTGTTRDLLFTAPGFGLQTYFLGASTSATPGIPTCGGIIPLDLSPVLDISLAPTNGVFVDFIGQLDADGNSTAPSLAVPDLPSFAGVDLVIGGAVLDLLSPCPVAAVTPPFALTTL